ncbi:hypothetical protein JOQ06_008599 [Pogonophryne albipinna]|uniref:Uncharacterized protein n=1 Tax=Pogonophryne albipinna TaxID=1090488 RepID=A0AAD6ALH2_9TELE|nr:hypothetical protein JOQ06_008599 [Pogonophryne albipinna]
MSCCCLAYGLPSDLKEEGEETIAGDGLQVGDNISYLVPIKRMKYTQGVGDTQMPVHLSKNKWRIDSGLVVREGWSHTKKKAINLVGCNADFLHHNTVNQSGFSLMRLHGNRASSVPRRWRRRGRENRTEVDGGRRRRIDTFSYFPVRI